MYKTKIYIRIFVVDRERNRRSICKLIENWTHHHRWHYRWVLDAGQQAGWNCLRHYCKWYQFEGMPLWIAINELFWENYSKANHYFALSFTKGWLPCRWVLPGWTIFEGGCATLPRSTNEKLGYNGWAASRSLWNPQLFRGRAFVLRCDQKGKCVPCNVDNKICCLTSAFNDLYHLLIF